MTFFGKRDRLRIITDILNSCRQPQTKTTIRRKTNLSYSILQNCIDQLIEHKLITQKTALHGQNRLALTEKGAVFLEKWFNLQKLMDPQNPLKAVLPEIQTSNKKLTALNYGADRVLPPYNRRNTRSK